MDGRLDVWGPILEAMALGIVAGVLVCLWLVGMVVWTRTRPLRRGEPPRPPAGPRRTRTGAATHLAWAGGAALAAWGWLSASGGRPWGWGFAAGGLVVVATGWARRVTEVAARPSGMRIGYRTGRAFELRWEDCRSVRPPRTPLGAWRIEGRAGSRSLMPSDVLATRWALETTIAQPGLVFRSGAWRRPGLAGVTAPRTRGPAGATGREAEPDPPSGRPSVQAGRPGEPRAGGRDGATPPGPGSRPRGAGGPPPAT